MPARTKRASLNDQLAALDNPAPVHRDPENEDAFPENDSASDNDGDSGSDDDDGGRSHYAEVGKSRLRDVAGETELKAAYKGQKSSRKAIFDESDAEESGDEDDMAAFERSDQADDSLEDDDEEQQSDGIGGSHSESESGSDQSGFSDNDHSEEESEDNSEDERQANELKKMLADDQKAMVQEVAKTATADAEKGAAVKKQLTIYDSLLDSRIKLQKGLQSTNLMTDLPNVSGDAVAVSEAEESALGLIETIFGLRADLMAQDSTTSPPNRKRKYDDGDDVVLEQLWADMKAFEDSLASWRDHTLTKWSNKIQAGSALDKGKKFKALNQGILAQIEDSKSDRGKLLKRTQIKRFKATSKTLVSNDDTSAEIYDDGDFYQEMLKDLIDSRMLDSTTNGNQMKWIATKQPKQKKANVDTRASKGRKLRYHVHEKIQNFMAPMPSGSWHEEQIDELFGSLLGQTLRVDEEEEEGVSGDEETRNAETVEVGDDFKLFG